MKTIPPLVGHRGASHHAPENTLPSYRLAFKEVLTELKGIFGSPKMRILFASTIQPPQEQPLINLSLM